MVVFARPCAAPVHLLLHRGRISLNECDAVQVTVKTRIIELQRGRLSVHLLGLFKAIQA